MTATRLNIILHCDSCRWKSDLFHKFGRFGKPSIWPQQIFNAIVIADMLKRLKYKLPRESWKTLKWCSLRVQGADEQAIEADPASVERERNSKLTSNELWWGGGGRGKKRKRAVSYEPDLPRPIELGLKSGKASAGMEVGAQLAVATANIWRLKGRRAFLLSDRCKMMQVTGVECSHGLITTCHFVNGGVQWKYSSVFLLSRNSFGSSAIRGISFFAASRFLYSVSSSNVKLVRLADWDFGHYCFVTTCTINYSEARNWTNNDEKLSILQTLLS